VVNDPGNSMNSHAKYAGNSVTTSKYSFLTFLPIALVRAERA